MAKLIQQINNLFAPSKVSHCHGQCEMFAGACPSTGGAVDKILQDGQGMTATRIRCLGSFS